MFTLLITLQSLSFFIHTSFFVTTLVQSLLTPLFIAKPAWFGLSLFIFLIDILFTVSFYYNTSNIVEDRIKSKEKDYSLYTWSSLFQTLMFLIVITPVAFTNLAVYSSSGLLIITDENRFKEYLCLFPILILPVLISWPILTIRYIKNINKRKKFRRLKH